MSAGLAAVTGATAGIGREFAEQLAQRGYDLLLVARDEARLAETAAALTGGTASRPRPFGRRSPVDEDVTRVAKRLGGTRAGDAGEQRRDSAPAGDSRRRPREIQVAMVRLHTLAPMRLTQAALPVLLRNRAGAVVNVSSIASFVYSAGNANYCATKAYLTSFSESVAAEVAGTGVRVQALCPGFTRTEFHGRMASPTGSPAVAWLSAERVVAYSLRCLDRGGPTVCIPGWKFRLAVGVLRHLPRGLIGWVTRRRYDRT